MFSSTRFRCCLNDTSDLFCHRQQMSHQILGWETKRNLFLEVQHRIVGFNPRLLNFSMVLYLRQPFQHRNGRYSSLHRPLHGHLLLKRTPSSQVNQQARLLSSSHLRYRCLLSSRTIWMSQRQWGDCLARVWNELDLHVLEAGMKSRRNQCQKLKWKRGVSQFIESNAFTLFFVAATLSKRNKNWKDDETIAFIGVWVEHQPKLEKPESRNTPIYNGMAEELSELLNPRCLTGHDVKTKIGNLSGEYRRRKTEQIKTGGSPCTWRYYDLLDKLLGRMNLFQSSWSGQWL